MPTPAVSAPSFEQSSHKEMFSLSLQSRQHHDDWEAYCPRLLACQIWTLDVSFRKRRPTRKKKCNERAYRESNSCSTHCMAGSNRVPKQIRTRAPLQNQDVPFRSSPHLQEKQGNKRVCIVRVTVVQPTVWQGATEYSNAHKN